jgi:hypothetical protein
VESYVSLYRISPITHTLVLLSACHTNHNPNCLDRILQFLIPCLYSRPNNAIFMPPQQGKSDANSNTMGSNGHSYNDMGDRRSYSRRSVRFPDEDEDDLEYDDDYYPRRGRSSSFSKRMEKNKARKLREQEHEQRLKFIRAIAVKAGILIVAGVSLCFSTLFVPGMLPFLGGLCCGVSLIEPPMLPGDGAASLESSSSEESYMKPNYAASQKQDSVVKRMLMNIINQLF